MNPATFGLILVSVSLNALAQVVLRKAMLTLGALPPLNQPIQVGLVLIGNVWLWAGMFCYAASIGLWLAVLSRVQVSAAYPMLSIGYIVNAVAAWYLFGEALSTMKLAGIGVIVAGVFIVARS